MSVLRGTPAQQNASLPQYMRDFASAQVLANLAYQDFDANNKPVSLLEPDGSWAAYDVKPFEGLRPGLTGVIFEKQSDPHEIKVAFRGTDNCAGAWRDTDSFGPGLLDFLLSQQKLLDQFEASIAGKEHVHVTIAGHSLGGADAGYFLMTLLKAHQESGRFNNIDKITIDTLNAPGAGSDCYQLAQTLLEKNASSQKPIEIEANIGTSDEDFIQDIGYKMFSNLDPNLAKIQLLSLDKFDCQSDYPNEIFDALLQLAEYFTAHSLSENYFEPDEMGIINPNYNHTVWDNQTEAGKAAIDTELSRLPPLWFMIPKTLQWGWVKCVKYWCGSIEDLINDMDVNFEYELENKLEFENGGCTPIMLEDVIDTESNIDNLFSVYRCTDDHPTLAKGFQDKAIDSSIAVHASISGPEFSSPILIQAITPEVI